MALRSESHARHTGSRYRQPEASDDVRSARSSTGRTSSWWAPQWVRPPRTVRTSGRWRIEPFSVRASSDDDAVLDRDANCIVYAAPAGPRPKEALADFCRILSAGKNIVTTSLPGLVYEKGSLSERYLEAIREACRAATARSSRPASSRASDGTCSRSPCCPCRTGCTRCAASRSPVARGSRCDSSREIFGFGQPLDYRAVSNAPGC